MAGLKVLAKTSHKNSIGADTFRLKKDCSSCLIRHRIVWSLIINNFDGLYKVQTQHTGALQDILLAFKDQENVRRLDEVRDHAGNDMLRAMQVVFPVASQIEMEVIEKYGFPADGDGVIRFTQAVKVYERQDQDVAQLNSQLRSILIPPIGMQEASANGPS